MGGYFRGGRWIEITWGDKISARLRSLDSKRRGPSKCLVCGRETSGYKQRKWCSPKCRYEASKMVPDRFDAKAVTAAANIRMGKGKKSVIAQLFRDAVGKPCAYCEEIVQLDKCQIDHKTPIGILRGTEDGKALDSIDNLQVVCRRCNITKGNMNDAAFRRLLSCFESDPEVRDGVWRRLGMSGHGWAKFRSRK